MKFCTIAAFCLAAGCISSAQAPPADSTAQNPTFKSGGEEVVVDVVVRDKKGHLVKDLKPEDLEIYDNSAKRAIKTFRLVEGQESVSSSGTHSQLDPLRQIRLVTLIFHSLDQDGRILSREAALDLIKSDLGQNVFMSVFDIDYRLQAIQSFTNDRDLLKKAIERATGSSHDFTHDNSQVVTQLQNMLGPNQGGGTSLGDQTAAMASNVNSGAGGASGKPDGGSAANAAMAQMMLQMINASQDDVTADKGRNSIFALLDVVREHYRLPGRKTILLFSSGFSIPQGMEKPFADVIAIANRSNVSFYAIDANGLKVVSENKSALDGLGSATAASRGNATPGKTVSMDMAKSEDRSIAAGGKNVQDTLGRLAHDTGGELIANTNDFRGPIRKINEDIQTYYEITYDPAIQNYDGSFRKISVKTSDATLRVQSRSGYFALPPALAGAGAALLPYEVPLMKALDTKPIPKQFAFQATGMHFRGTTGAPTCDVVLDVPIANLTLEQNKDAKDYEGKLAYVALVKDSQGQVVKKLRDEVALKVTEDKLAAFKAGHFVYSKPFDLQPGRYTLESAVLDSQGEKLSARKSSFMIPLEGSRLSISSIAVVRNMLPAGQDAQANDPLIMNQKVITPSVNPTVKKSDGEGLPFYVVIYPDKSNAEKPALEMEFSKEGQILGKVPAQLGDADAQGHIQFVATAPLAKLDPGSYQVRFIAKQGAEAAVESVSFSLEP